MRVNELPGRLNVKKPDPNRRVFLKTVGAGASGVGLTGRAGGEEDEQATAAGPAEILWRAREDGEQGFFLDPLEGEKAFPNEPLFVECLARLPRGVGEYRFAPGRTEMTPDGPLVVGGCYDFAFTYFPEDEELPAGTTVAFSIPRTWTQPQTDGAGPGFVSVKRSTGGACNVRLTHNGNMTWWILVELAGEAEPPKGFVRVEYRQAAVQRFPQDWFGNYRNSMRTAVDREGTGQYAFVRAERTAKPAIRSAPPARFHVAAPAVARPGEKIEVRASTLDFCDNRAWPPPEGDVFAAMPDDPFRPVASTTLESKDQGTATLEVDVPDRASHVRVIVSNRKDNLQGHSPVVVVDDRPETMNVYFGDIHAKTMLSDGLKTPREFFEHARDVALIDFAAIADHNSVESSRLEGPFRMQMADETYAQIQEACEAMNAPGRFATIQAFEQNQIAKQPGHRNVYFRGTCPGLFRGETLEDLYAYLEGHQALVIPHHHIIWGTRVHLDNPRYERIIEMYSMHCSSEVRGTPLNNHATTTSKRETGISAREILDLGHRVGFIAASDNHNGAPGLSARPSRFTNIPYRGGLAAVLAPKLTREDVFDGLYNRRCYATTGARTYLDFRLAGQLMGSEIKSAPGAALPYEITVGGTDRIARIELIQNDRVATVWSHDGRDFVRVEGELAIDASCWTYVRVTQADRHMAWSSPIWIDVA